MDSTGSRLSLVARRYESGDETSGCSIKSRELLYQLIDYWM